MKHGRTSVDQGDTPRRKHTRDDAKALAAPPPPRPPGGGGGGRGGDHGQGQKSIRAGVDLSRHGGATPCTTEKTSSNPDTQKTKSKTQPDNTKQCPIAMLPGAQCLTGPGDNTTMLHYIVCTFTPCCDTHVSNVGNLLNCMLLVSRPVLSPPPCLLTISLTCSVRGMLCRV